MTAHETKRGPGRPPVDAEQALSAIFSVRLSRDERQAVEEAAARAGKKAGAWARDVLLAVIGGAAVDEPKAE